MKKVLTAAALAGLLLTGVSASLAAGFTDSFDSIDSAWVTDRYAPAGFSSANFDGDNRLKIDISTADSAANRPGSYSSMFYNTQGKQRAANLGPTWTVSGSLFVSEDMLSGNSLRRTDLWARTGDSAEANATYAIFGIRRFDPNDAFNPNSNSLSTVWRVWDEDVATGWVDLASTVSAGWNSLSIIGDGSSLVYSLNGNVVYTDNTVRTAYPNLTTAFAEAYNFGDSNYSVYWDNISAQATPAVPEPATLMLGIMGIGSVVGIRRFRK